MKNLKKAALATSTLAFGSAVNAADWSTQTGAMDFSGEITAVQAIVGLLASVGIVMVGGKKVLLMLRG